MLQYDFEESVGYWIAMTSHSLRRALDSELARQKITFRQWEVLAWISLEGELSQADMAERLGIEAPTLAGILSRMERDGWLTRDSCPHDRRRKILHATPKAEALWTQMTDCCRRIRAQATLGVSEDELATLRRLCEKIRDNLNHCTPSTIEVSVSSATN